ncbi:hypothetical protein [Aureivirga sp. CE67]|uniref:hypothetical protein n=1 Tax=Aureivirga sp. CE67 TaxID=1788983 RepID=UPI0018CA7BB2|nr:hypothetical protein [Aureivirga sp. CE67]
MKLRFDKIGITFRTIYINFMFFMVFGLSFGQTNTYDRFNSYFEIDSLKRYNSSLDSFCVQSEPKSIEKIPFKFKKVRERKIENILFSEYEYKIKGKERFFSVGFKKDRFYFINDENNVIEIKEYSSEELNISPFSEDYQVFIKEFNVEKVIIAEQEVLDGVIILSFIPKEKSDSLQFFEMQICPRLGIYLVMKKEQNMYKTSYFGCY